MATLRAGRELSAGRIAVGASRANGSARAEVADIQRARILSAMFEVACERGVASVTVAHVVERSGVSRRTFYELFEDRQACFLAAFEEAVAHVSGRVLPAYRAQRRWQERIRAGLAALLAFLDEEPALGRVLIAESLAGGAQVLARRNRILARILQAVDGGRAEPRGAAAAPPPLAAEGAVGGALAIVHARLAEPDHGPLSDLLNPLMSMIALPYLGAAAARRELQRPSGTPAVSRHEPALASDPFKDAGLRLTYRTVRVLMAIAEHPDASNRGLGELADVKDQGQISKLLGRLERSGLVRNSGLGPGQGGPNAWSLTAKGQQVVQTTRIHTQDS